MSPKDSPSFIIVNAKVLTMDPSSPRAEAIAIGGNTIAAVGTKADVLALKVPSTRVIDAAGNSVLPGLIEGHVHVFLGAAELDNLDLSGVHGRDELTVAIRNRAAKQNAPSLIFANQVSYAVLDDKILPTRRDLDVMLPDRPLAMMTYDHHTVFANTKALEAAGILKGGDAPRGSEIVMGSDGLATGELREPGAFRHILKLTPTAGRDALGYTEAGEPSPSPAATERGIDLAILERGQKYLASFGITSAHNMDGNFYQLELLQELDDTGRLLVRVESPFHFKNTFDLGRLEDASTMRRQYCSERVSSGRVKVFMDGVLESWTALTLQDYPDKPDIFGDPNFTAAQFTAVAIEADRRGLQICVHAIADGAVRRTLDGFEAARRANGSRDSRHRIEHIETIHPSDLPRLAQLGVVASLQPTHAPGVIFPLEPTLSRIRPTDYPNAYAWQAIRRAGAHIMFNSDWPVAPVDPMLSIMAAMMRKPYRKGDPEHRQTLTQAIEGYTSGAAYGEFKEHRKGMLRPGMLADVVVESADLELTAPEKMPEVRPLYTICDGKITHTAA